MHELKEQLRKARLNREQEEVEVKEEEKEEETQAEECRVKFTPGVIIKLILDQPITNMKHFKVSTLFRFIVVFFFYSNYATKLFPF